MRPSSREQRKRIFAIWALCREHDFHLSIAWMPRGAGPIPEADAHTRMYGGQLRLGAARVGIPMGVHGAWHSQRLLPSSSTLPAQQTLRRPLGGSPRPRLRRRRWLPTTLAHGGRRAPAPSASSMAHSAARMGEVLDRLIHVLVYPMWPKPWRTRIPALPVVASATIPAVDPADGANPPLLIPSRLPR